MKYSFLQLILIAALGLTAPVHAQDLADDLAFLLDTSAWQAGYPVLPQPGREIPPLPELAETQRPTGFVSGPFTVQPTLTAGAFFDDNVFATQTNRQSDWAYFLRPGLSWRAQGPDHSFVGQAHVEAKRYARFESENALTGAVSLASLIQPERDTQLHGRMRYVHGQESRGSGESVLTQFAEPVTFDQFEVAAGINHRKGRHWVSLGGGASWVSYGTPTVGGVPITQSYRDGVVTLASARAGYVVAPRTSVFVEVSGNRRDYEVDSFDSRGYRVVGGVLLEPGTGARVRGEAYFGYMHQDFVGATFQTVSTWTFGGALAIETAPNVSMTLLGSRDAKESTLNGGGSLVETLAGVRFDYQVNPRFSIGAGVTYLVDEYLGGNRTDRTWSPLASAKFMLSPTLTLALDYRYQNFDSTGAGAPGYARNVYLFAVNGRI